MPSRCDITNCSELNYVTANYTADWGDIRYFCDEHWEIIRLFFSKVAAKECNGCKRNHHAETEISYFKEQTVKYMNKYWDLCKVHLATYEDALNYFNLESPED